MRIEALSGYDVPSYHSIVSRIGVNRAGMFGSLKRLSSGMKINTAGDSPSGLAMSERLRSLIGRYDAAIENADNAVSYLHTSDGFMQTMQDTLGRMQELAVAANDGTKSDADREMLGAEFEQLKGTITDITSGDAPLGVYNGNRLFQGSSISLAVGPEAGEQMSLSALDLRDSSAVNIGNDHEGNPIQWAAIVNSPEEGGIDISTQSAAASSIQALSSANDFMSQARAVRGAEESRIMQNIGGLREAQVNSVQAESGIRDADMAEEMISFSKYQTMTLFGSRMLSGQMASRFLAQA